MTKTSIIFIAAASVAALTTTSVLAQDRMMRGERFLKRADVNNDGKLTVDEVVNQATARFDKTDSNNDGEISVEEMADRIQRERDERRAARMLERMDFNGDGKVTKDELENRAKKRFALMDRNDDGIVEKLELRKGRKGMRRHGQHRRKMRRWRERQEEL